VGKEGEGEEGIRGLHNGVSRMMLLMTKPIDSAIEWHSTAGKATSSNDRRQLQEALCRRAGDNMAGGT
jgi:hypothetical protein